MNDTRETPAEVMSRLGELSADDIASLLISKGIRGRRSSGQACPIALYLTRESGYPVIVCPTWYAQRGPTDTDTIEGAAGNPDSVETFIKAFDMGDYPQLESRA